MSEQINSNFYHCEVPYKHRLMTLFGFVRSHLNSKIIISVTSSNEVDFLTLFFNFHEIICSYITGKQEETQKNFNLNKFIENERSILIVTNFYINHFILPQSDWTIHFNIPESLNSILKIFNSNPTKNNLLLFPKNEYSFILKLKENNILIKNLSFDEKKIPKLIDNLQHLLKKNYSFYTSSIFSYKDFINSYVNSELNEIFIAKSLPLLDIAINYGINAPPKVPLTK